MIDDIWSKSEAFEFISTCCELVAPGITTLMSSCIKIHFSAKSIKLKLVGNNFFNLSTASNPLLKSTPEKVSPTSKDFP